MFLREKIDFIEKTNLICCTQGFPQTNKYIYIYKRKALLYRFGVCSNVMDSIMISTIFHNNEELITHPISL